MRNLSIKKRKDFTFFIIFISILIIPSCAIVTLGTLGLNNAIPLNELEQRLSHVNDGETIIIKSGNYEGINIKINNSFNRNVTIKAESPGSVILSGNSRFTFVSSNNVTLNGFMFESIPIRSPIVIANSSGIVIENNYFNSCGSKPNDPIIRIENKSSKNQITHNTFDDPRSICIALMSIPDRSGDRDIRDNLISYNYFVNTKAVGYYYPNARNGMETIQLGQGSEATHSYEFHTIISKNLFENIVGDGGEIISVKTSRNKIVQNTFLNNNSGITLRFGDYNEVSGNYLKETTRGIRLFGKGHRINNNYIVGGVVGIDMPNTDYLANEAMVQTGYFQQYDVVFRDNIIQYSRINAIRIGGGRRKLTPDNLVFERNRIFVKNSEEDYFFANETTQSRVNFVDNEVLVENENTLNSRSVRAGNSKRLKDSRDEDINILQVIGVEHYQSNDPDVGASWKRPIIKN